MFFNTPLNPSYIMLNNRAKTDIKSIPIWMRLSGISKSNTLPKAPTRLIPILTIRQKAVKIWFKDSTLISEPVIFSLSRSKKWIIPSAILFWIPSPNTRLKLSAKLLKTSLSFSQAALTVSMTCIRPSSWLNAAATWVIAFGMNETTFCIISPTGVQIATASSPLPTTSTQNLDQASETAS